MVLNDTISVRTSFFIFSWNTGDIRQIGNSFTFVFLRHVYIFSMGIPKALLLTLPILDSLQKNKFFAGS
jgi:hypothetical protein